MLPPSSLDMDPEANIATHASIFKALNRLESNLTQVDLFTFFLLAHIVVSLS
jgi:hypothetical protein